MLHMPFEQPMGMSVPQSDMMAMSGFMSPQYQLAMPNYNNVA